MEKQLAKHLANYSTYYHNQQIHKQITINIIKYNTYLKTHKSSIKLINIINYKIYF